MGLYASTGLIPGLLAACDGAFETTERAAISGDFRPRDCIPGERAPERPASPDGRRWLMTDPIGLYGCAPGDRKASSGASDMACSVGAPPDKGCSLVLARGLRIRTSKYNSNGFCLRYMTYDVDGGRPVWTNVDGDTSESLGRWRLRWRRHRILLRCDARLVRLRLSFGLRRNS